ncbi:MAG: helix-turn-helix domain-containing protein [Methylovirgula sp.]
MRDALCGLRNLHKFDWSEDPTSIHPGKGLDPRRLQRVLDFIDDHLADNITIKKLAEIACLSAFHFARAFKAAVRRPPHHYVRDRRLRYAAMLLTGSLETLSGISLACGFSSPGNFSRAFHRATGVTPGQYRLATTGACRVCNGAMCRSCFVARCAEDAAVSSRLRARCHARGRIILTQG